MCRLNNLYEAWTIQLSPYLTILTVYRALDVCIRGKPSAVSWTMSDELDTETPGLVMLPVTAQRLLRLFDWNLWKFWFPRRFLCPTNFFKGWDVFQDSPICVPCIENKCLLLSRQGSEIVTPALVFRFRVRAGKKIQLDILSNYIVSPTTI